MRWKQFFTPVKSISAPEAREIIENTATDAVTVLDVRQPNEYEEVHIPGATLIPLPELDSRMKELDAEKKTIVYCAIGGRSRVAAQMLAGRGFDHVIKMAGGFKAWNGLAASGTEHKGMQLFTGRETLEETLAVAYSLEEGLRDFYIQMSGQIKNKDAVDVFEKLSRIEQLHQDRIFAEYKALTGRDDTLQAFKDTVVTKAMEGGLSTNDYLALFALDITSPREVTEIAMSIEAQALDLYSRAAARATDERSRAALTKIADEERVHLKELGKLMESL